jgi:hypothetical protein
VADGHAGRLIGRRRAGFRYWIKDQPCRLRVIHSQNLLNAVPRDNPLRVVHKDAPGKIEFLRYFSIDPAALPVS